MKYIILIGILIMSGCAGSGAPEGCKCVCDENGCRCECGDECDCTDCGCHFCAKPEV